MEQKKILSRCPLFSGLTEAEMGAVLREMQVKEKDYEKHIPSLFYLITNFKIPLWNQMENREPYEGIRILPGYPESKSIWRRLPDSYGNRG